ncbi:histidine-containing phosphotransfer protein 5 [Citrus sinensis]|uniref:Histidine-containing phosphotransfer protein 5 n=1 Tax=Citrus sinensis TaxID=2711 RepID=A0ACB8NQ92_CITSI|nr:histidine-containing phosphotransfer protein 5 [Citrus sinensis]KAH9799759.1 histidine-containing phosphotransfer protein 5 [Citrus sinensis]
MNSNQLQHQVLYMRRSLFDQGYLDSEQLIQLEDLQDDANPNFVEEVVSLFYSDSARLIQNIEQTLSNRPVDFSRLDDILHQFKGSCSRCSRSFQLIKQEYETLRRRLESYFQMVKQAKAA